MMWVELPLGKARSSLVLGSVLQKPQYNLLLLGPLLQGHGGYSHLESWFTLIHLDLGLNVFLFQLVLKVYSFHPSQGMGKGSCLQGVGDRAWMCARLYPHMSPLSTQSKAKEGKRREMAETIFIFYDQIPVQNVVESKNPKLNLVFKLL